MKLAWILICISMITVYLIMYARYKIERKLLRQIRVMGYNEYSVRDWCYMVECDLQAFVVSETVREDYEKMMSEIKGKV